MFICTECNSVFEEPELWEETHGLNTPPYEQWYGCPYCSGSYIETYKCDCCENWITTDVYVKTKDDKRYCDDCFLYYNLGDE